MQGDVIKLTLQVGVILLHGFGLYKVIYHSILIKFFMIHFS